MASASACSSTSSPIRPRPAPSWAWTTTPRRSRTPAAGRRSSTRSCSWWAPCPSRCSLAWASRCCCGVTPASTRWRPPCCSSPIALTPLVAGLVWRAILNADFGTIGYYLTTLLGVRRGLTAQSDTAMLSVILVDAWQWTPLVMLILLAGLKTLPAQPFEAARVDGGSSWAIFRNLTLPMLAPTILLALLFRTMDAFRVFDAIFAMTQGGPGLSTTVLNYYVYKQGLVFFDMGFAASLSTILLVVIGAFSLVYIRLIGRQERARARAGAG
ncbi:MAG: sugar ABC transporter permease [Chloroflexota bacterium]